MLTPDIFFKISGFVSLIVNGALGVFVFLRNPKRSLNIRFALFSLCIAFWSVGSAYVNVIRNEDVAIWALRQSYLFGVFVPPLFLHFVTTFVGWDRKFKVCLLIAYSIAVVLVFFVFSPLFIPAYRVLSHYGGYRIDVPGPAYTAFAIFFILTIFSTLILLLIFYFKRALGNQKNQLKFIFVGYFFGTLAGLEYFLGVFGILKRPPFDDYMLILTFAFMAYAIVRHRALDIEVVIKKTLIFAGVFGMAMVVVSFVSTVMRVYVSKYWTVDPNISTLISVLLAMTLYRPTRDLLIKITDKFLFQKKAEIKVILNSLSKQIVTIVDVDQIGKTILSTLKETIRLESGMIFLENKNHGNFRMIDHFGMSADELSGSIMSLIKDSSIIDYFFRQKPVILNLDHADGNQPPEAVTNWLKMAKARVSIPLFINEDQFGLIALGKKKSDQEFTGDESDYFPTIASQAALAIRNARLVEKVLEEREAKIKAEHVAKRVKFARTIKHEQKNTLATMESIKFLSMYHIPDLKKAFKEQDEAWFLEGCEKIAKTDMDIRKGIDKILDIAEASLGGLEAGEQSHRKMSFKVIWEDAKESSGVKDCDYETSIPDGFAVYVQYTPFERVLENLIINANDAMKNQSQKLIRLSCISKEVEGQSVAYFEFRDNGPGIPKAILEKIFEEGYSTKPKPNAKDLSASGYGQGLYVCKYNIENLHHGKMWAECEPGEGGIFKFWIPIEANGNSKN